MPQGVICTSNPDVGGVRNITCGLEDRFTSGQVNRCL